MARPERNNDMPPHDRDTKDDAEVHDEVEALKADMAALREDLRTLVGDLVAAGKVQAGEAGEALSDAARSRLQEYGVDLDRLAEVKDSVQDHVERHPLTSVAIAVGVGILLGRIFRR